jgi:hypothetical protein
VDEKCWVEDGHSVNVRFDSSHRCKILARIVEMDELAMFGLYSCSVESPLCFPPVPRA